MIGLRALLVVRAEGALCERVEDDARVSALIKYIRTYSITTGGQKQGFFGGKLYGVQSAEYGVLLTCSSGVILARA